MDTDDKGKKMLGDRLTIYRESVNMSVGDLATKVSGLPSPKGKGSNRSYIYDVEAGRANVTIDVYANLLRACGVSLETCLKGLWESKQRPEHQELHQLLEAVINYSLDSGDETLLRGSRVMLEALSEKAARLKKAREPSSPATREGAEGNRKESGETTIRKRKQSA